MRRFLLSACLVLMTARGAVAQNLEDTFRKLYTFGSCGEPLCLTLSQEHGRHFVPDVVQGQNNLLGFIQSALGASIANIPIGGTSGGTTFMFRNGVPVATSVSAGPVYAERAQTLGRGRLLGGASVTGVDFTSIRGVPLNGLEMNFTHQNVQGAALGDPAFEEDIIQVHTALSVNLLVTSFFATYGLLDQVDLSVLVPVVRTSLSGTSHAQLLPISGEPVHDFGTAGNLSLDAFSSASGSAFGIGDVVGRVKVNLSRSASGAFAVLGDVRFPTGKADQFLGSGTTTVRALAIASGRRGNFAPHLNAGYMYRNADSRENNYALATLGYDQLVAPTVTFALDLLSQWEVGKGRLTLPGPVHFDYPLPHDVTLSNVPDRRDNLMDGAVGFKLRARSGLSAVANALIPLNRGGVRPNVVWTLGVERQF